MDGTRSALIVASSEYADPGLRQLRAPASDAEALAAVLRDPQIGGFAVRTLLDRPAHEINLAVEEFFADRHPDDLLLLHVSCHGVKDEGGDLYFAAANTLLRRLGSTAVAAEFVNRRMSRTRSRRVVLLLDCCYAGAFERGMTARAGTGVGIEEQFGGRGRAVITASSAMEYAFEGDELADIGELTPSVFTSALVEGLETGDADRDQDGRVGLDELYDYVYDKVRETTPNQTPGKWTFGVQGDLYIARRSRPVSTPAPLPPELAQAVDHPLAAVRAGAVQELIRVLSSDHAGLALAARLTLERLVDDDSRTVAAAATAALNPQPSPSRTQQVAVLPDIPPAPAPALAPEPDSTSPDAAPPDPSPAAAPQAAPAHEADRPSVATPPPAVTGDGRLRVAGMVAIAGAVLLVATLSQPYQYTDVLGSSRPGAESFVLIVAALALSAGVSTLPSRTLSLIGPGLLLGSAAASTWGLLAWTSDVLMTDGFGIGFGLGLVAQAILVFAACLAGLALKQVDGVRLVRRPAEGGIAWLVVILSVVGGVALLAQAQAVQDGDNGWYAWPLIWAAVMAVVVPGCATLAVPTRLGASLLMGWIGSGVAITAFYFTSLEAFFYLSRNLVLVFGLTLLALLVAAILLARVPAASQRLGD